jgi:integrase
MHNDRLLSDSRRKTVASAINKHLIPMLSDLPLSELNHDSIDKLFWMPLQAKYELASIKAWFSMLKRSTKEATAFKLLEVDPMVGITFGNFTTVSIQPRTGRLRPQQVSQLFKELKPVSARHMALFMLLLLCGTRIGETRRAKWAHMDNEGWYIPPEHTKTRSMHRLPMTPVLARVLAWWRPQTTSSFVFPANNKRCLSGTEASTLIRDLSKREWTAHDLRKLARTCWADLGVDYMVGELLLNHTLSRLDQTYIHTHAEKQKKIALESYHQWLLDNGLDDLLKGLEAETIARR